MMISNFSWGSMQVSIDGETRVFKDCKLWPGGAHEWDWNETGTHHDPGIQPADIEDILAQGVDVLVLTRGQLGRLGVAAETESLLQKQGIPYHIEKTKKAVQLFNDLTEQGKRVGGLFHSTC
ncbi:MAG: hypothetical protein Kow002_13440 [Anaerolineales bacterium]